MRVEASVAEDPSRETVLVGAHNMNQRMDLASGYEGAKKEWQLDRLRISAQDTSHDRKVWGKCGACVECGEERSTKVCRRQPTRHLVFLSTIAFSGLGRVCDGITD